MRIYLLVMLLALSGCTTMDHNKLISPSESLYYKANQLYEDKEYAAAIGQYEAFLEAKPRSQLAPSASLNIGMSYYYQEDYKQAYDALKDVNIKDENIKKYVAEIVEICKTKAKKEIEAEEQAKAAAAAGAAETGEIEVTVLDAYLDNFGAVVIQGKVSQEATLIIGNKKINSDNNHAFTATASWKRGESIHITAKGVDGSISELYYYPDGQRPEKPLGLRAINITSNSIEIEWDENTEPEDDDIKGYLLFYRAKGGSLHEVPELITDIKHEVVGLAGRGSNTIEFFLRAVDKMDNESEDSDILEVDLL